MATNAPTVSREDSRLSPVDPDSDYNRYRNRSQEEQVLDYIPPPPSQPTALGNALNRSRRTQKMGGYLSKLPPPSSSDESSASFSSNSNSNSRTSSTSSVNDLPPSQPVYVLSDKPVPKSKPKTTKGFRSKLSKQYTPSDDESDEEPLGIKVLAFPAPPPSPTAPLSPPLPGMSHARSSMFMSGRAVELNSDCGAVSRGDRNFGRGAATESLRVVSMNDATMPSLALNTTMDRMETASLSSKTKKLSLMKRMSKLFSNGPKKAARPASTPPLATARESGTAQLGPSSSTSSRLSPTPSTKGHHKPSMEVLEESPSRQVLQPGSQQGPAFAGQGPSSTGMLPLPPSVLKAHRDRNTRDSGFDDTENSLNTGAINSNNVNRPPVNGASQQGRHSMLMPTVHSQNSHASQPSFNRHSFSAEMMPPSTGNQSEVAIPRPSLDQHQHVTQRSAPAPAPALPDQAQHRFRQQGGDIPLHPHETQRRTGTPLMYTAAPSQTLVSRIDREKSTVCFQSSPPVEAIATKGAAIAPTTSRQQPSSSVLKPLQLTLHQTSPILAAVVSFSGQESGEKPMGANGPRRDSSGSQETNASSTYTSTTTTTGISSISGVGHANGTGSGHGNSSSISTAKSKAMASYSPGLALQQHVTFEEDTNTKTSQPRRVSAGITSKIQSLTPSKTQQQQPQQKQRQQQTQSLPPQQQQQQHPLSHSQQQQQPSQPVTNRQRASPKRQSTASYFTMAPPALQLQQHNQQLKQLQQLQTSPTNTPPLNSPPAPIAAMNSAFLNPSSSILSSGALAGSPLLDPSWALQQQQQQLQQQIELQLQQQYQQNQHLQLQLQLDQLQHLQMQQHQILMQQQQIDKTRAALMASTSAIVTQQHQQQQLLMMPNFMYPTAAVAATATAAGPGGVVSPINGLASGSVGVAPTVK